MPSGAAISRTCARCAISSDWVWCTVSTGAPDSSNWPPGSSEIAPPPVTSYSPMMLPRSMIGSQPSRSCMPSSSAPMPRAPFVRHGMMAFERERRLLVLGADPEFGRRLHARFQPRHQFVARLQRRHIDLVTRHEDSGCGALRRDARGVGGIREPTGPEMREVKTISSDGRAVSCGEQLRLAAGAAQPVEQTAELGGIRVGQFRADVLFDRG